MKRALLLSLARARASGWGWLDLEVVDDSSSMAAPAGMEGANDLEAVRRRRAHR
jgi:hypothetical protein